MAINTKQPGDSGYIALFRGKRIELYAPTKLRAQQAAASHFRARKAYEVTVELAESKDGQTVTHIAVD